MTISSQKNTIAKLKEETNLKETLLDVAAAVASIQDRKELFKVIFEKVKPVLPFDAPGLFVVDGKNHYEILDEESASDEHNEQVWDEIGIGPFLNKGTFIQEAIDFEKNEIKFTEQITHPHIPVMLKSGLKQIIYGPLKVSGTVIGLFCLNSKESDTYKRQNILLFKGFCDLIAVAISNVLAKEEMLKQNYEKALKIEVTNALNEELDWNQLLLHLVTALENYFPFDTMVFRLLKNNNDELSANFEKIGGKEYRHLNSIDFIKLANLNEREYASAFNALNSNAPYFENKLNRTFAKDKSVMLLINSYWKVKSIMVIPLIIPGGYTMYLYFFSKKNGSYNDHVFSMLKALSSALILGLKKQLAYEEIQLLNSRLKEEKQYLKEQLNTKYSFHNMIGESSVIKGVFKQVKDVASLSTPILIQGETGTGKELIARAIHEGSERKDHLLVKVNCAALPSHIVESELFGHQRGAFTGAIKDRIGKFELADKGTIFLDEIGELPLELQAKLLRVLQEKEVEPIGSNITKQLNFRVIAATNRKLEEEVRKGTFRADLYYRLHIYPIYVPPLHVRGNDILLIAEHVAKEFSHKLGVTYRGFSEGCKKRILLYHWPGNVRELQNNIEQAMVSNREEIINFFPGQHQHKSVNDIMKHNELDITNEEEITSEFIKNQKEKLEITYLTKVLEQTKWRVSGPHGAARVLGMNENTLQSKIRRFALKQ